jgi:nitrogen PTS system EIIA component
MKEKKVFSAKEVSKLLDTSPVTVQRWAYQGKIPCKLKKDSYVFKEADIIQWAKSHGIPLAKTESKPTTPARPVADTVSLENAVARGGIIQDLKGGDIYSVLKNMVDHISLPPNVDKDMVFNELINREEIASTGMGKGVAIPHPRLALNLNLEYPIIPVAFLQQPIDFNAVDSEPVFVLFMLLSPSIQIHLKLLSKLSICFRNKEFITHLAEKPNKDSLLQQIRNIEEPFQSESR